MRRSAVGSGRRTAAASATRTSCTGPAGIAARGELRHQYAHAIDIVPTVLDALGIRALAQVKGVTQAPVEGVSFTHVFDDADAPTQYP